jgi:integrase
MHRADTPEPISEKVVAALPAPPNGNKLHYFSKSKLQGKTAPSGFAVRVTSAGTKSFVWFHRVDGKPHLETLGRWSEQGGPLTVLAAIIAAKARADAIHNDDADPRPDRTRRLEDGDKPDGLTVAGMLDMFIERYAKEKKLRSVGQYEKTFERLVKPDIGDYGIYDLRRSHVVSMLDDIADESGPRMADLTLAYFRKACNWYALRDESFNSPIVKGMARGDSNAERKRFLSDDEIRDLWAALEIVENVPTCYPRFVKSILLCATRRNESAQMHSSEIDGDAWVIPGERYKRLPKHRGYDHVIPLTAATRELLGDKPQARRNSWFIFSTTDGEKPFSGFSKAKRELDKALAKIREQEGREAMPAFRLHDLRRTARTLMSRGGVSPDHAERALGHIIGGVRGIYDCYEFLAEKKKAFEALAALLAQILDPTPNVTQIASHRARPT